MNASAFDTLYEIVTTHGAGWEDALYAAWFGPCGLDDDQKSLLEVAA